MIFIEKWVGRGYLLIFYQTGIYETIINLPFYQLYKYELH